MPRLLTMGTIVTRAKQVADMANDDSIADVVWKWFISMVYGDELWPEVSLGALDRYFETSTTITADGSTSYDEPAAHFSTVRIVRVDASGREFELTQLRQGDELAYKSLTGDAVAWTHVDDQLFLYPAPSSGTYKWYYQQQPTDLSGYGDSDVVDVVVPAGESLLIWGVAAMALQHHKQDASFALQQKAAALPRVQFQVANRNSSETRTRGPVVDDDEVTYGADGWPVR